MQQRIGNSGSQYKESHSNFSLFSLCTWSKCTWLCALNIFYIIITLKYKWYSVGTFNVGTCFRYNMYCFILYTYRKIIYFSQAYLSHYRSLRVLSYLWRNFIIFFIKSVRYSAYLLTWHLKLDKIIKHIHVFKPLYVRSMATYKRDNAIFLAFVRS